MRRFTLFALLSVLTLLALASVGCASKKYVRNQTGPTIDKVNELDDLTAKNTRDIKDVDTRAQQGIQQVTAKANEADQKAMASGQQADQAQSSANQAAIGTNALTSTVANLDKYKPVVDTTVHFGFDKYNLTPQAKKALDELGSEISKTRHFIVVVDGNTDSVGPSEYNYVLSQRRADAVINYLATRYNVPPHKIYLIGLGKDKPAMSNKSVSGRAENRRVDVRLMTNLEEENATSVPQSTAVNRQQ